MDKISFEQVQNLNIIYAQELKEIEIIVRLRL